MARFSSVLLFVVAALVLLLTIHGEVAHHEVVEDKTGTERVLRGKRILVEDKTGTERILRGKRILVEDKTGTERILRGKRILVDDRRLAKTPSKQSGRGKI
jgi:hypothetical protein